MRLVYMLPANLYSLQKSLDIIRQVHDGPRVSLLSMRHCSRWASVVFNRSGGASDLGGSTGAWRAPCLTSLRINQIATTISAGIKAISPSAIQSWGVIYQPKSIHGYPP